MKRAEAFALVRQRGGTPRESVTRSTSVLIVGELGWPLLDDGRPSNKLTQAKCYGVPIASERQFLAWIGKAPVKEQVRTYTPEQLAALSKLPAEVIEQLASFGLIEPADGCYGFRDVAAARQVAALIASGTKLSTITRSLHEIRKWLPEAHLANLRLFPESADSILIEQAQGRADRKGQLLLPVGLPDDDPDLLFEQAQAAEAAGDLAAAERLYRRVMKLDPADPAVPFNLANLLRSAGRPVEAEAIYRLATRADPAFAPAWYNLADLLENEGRTTDAVDCLERAIAADSGHGDAIFNLALLLQKLERHADAASWWRRYLALESSAPWAARAKRALKFCEIQLAGSS
jgi:tetratricopeptide (TPR) repeat protein